MNDDVIGMVGAAPIVKVRPIEREIYRQMWEREEYRVVAPGEELVQLFLETARPKPGAHVIDFGTGTGRGALGLALFGRMRVTMLDFADNCLDADIRPMLVTQAHALDFHVHDLTKPVPVRAPYGFCTDVMEHIPPQDVDRVLDNILHAAQHCFFQIATEPDLCGAAIGHALHLTVQPYEWWVEKFQKRGAVIHWSQEVKGACLFYLSAWATGAAIVEHGVLNTTQEVVRRNVEQNIAQGYVQVTPYPTNDVEVMILGGGPTLDQFEDDIKEKRAAGVKLVCLNNTHEWAVERGLLVSAHVMVDARPFNARFIQRVQPQCKYMLASQCDPACFEKVPNEQVMLWHTTTEHISDLLRQRYKIYFGVPGGSTVLLRAIPLLRMLGFRRFHLYGCDSCVIGNKHHAYAQAENDTEIVIPVSVSGGRIFNCQGWHIAQAQEFMDLIRFMGDEFELQVHGDGLLAHILESGETLDDAEQAQAVTP